MMQKPSFDLHELLQYVLLEARAAWRYRWHALIVAWCVMIVGALLVFSLPNKYEATAQVYADTDALTNPLLRGLAVQPDMRGRLQIITQTLLSRPNLEEVADKTGLSLRATTPADKDALLVKLGSAVRIKTAGAKNLYNLSYADPDRHMAQKVVQSFLQILMNDTLGANTASTATAENFLQQQVNDYSQRLDKAEKNLAEFKQANAAYLPTRGAADYTTRLRAAEDKLQDLQSDYAAVAAGRAPSRTSVNPRVEAIDQQIAGYQQRLDKLLLTYTEAYPDVISTRRAIAELQARRKTALQHPGAAPTAPSGTGQSRARLLAAQIAAQKQEIARLKSSGDKIIDAQVKLQRLTRNYDVTRKQYDQLLTRLNTAQMSQDASQTGNNLKFRVINPPTVPLLPVSPERGLLLLLTFAMAVAIGAGFAYFMHKVRPVFVSLKGLRESGGFPVLGGLSLMVSQARRRQRRREVVGFCTGAGLLAVVLVLGIALTGPITHLVQQVFVMGAV